MKTLEILLAPVDTVTQKVSFIPIFELQGITKVYQIFFDSCCNWKRYDLRKRYSIRMVFLLLETNRESTKSIRLSKN